MNNDAIYLNCGDWVESCTALIEHHDGTIELVRSSDMQAVIKRLPARHTDTLPPLTEQAA